jgi:hypothetical protein
MRKIFVPPPKKNFNKLINEAISRISKNCDVKNVVASKIREKEGIGQNTAESQTNSFQVGGRVTRLGETSPFGRIFSLKNRPND